MDNRNPESIPRLYSDLARWFHLLTAPEDYAEEAEFFHQAIQEISEGAAESMLELGSGGGNNASHLKNHYHMTLMDVSDQMLEISLELNPECEHILGDMRTVRLDRVFDVVFIHDAIGYMLSEEDLRQVASVAGDKARDYGYEITSSVTRSV